MRETWYVLEDGSVADPNEVAPDEAGKLVHKSGVAVAMRGSAHSSRSVDADEERAKAVKVEKPAKEPEPKPEPDRAPVETKAAPAHDNRQMKAKHGKPYKTR